MMNCEATQKALSPYLDGELTRGESLAVDAHLDVCPVCRLRLVETRALVRRLALGERPAPPAELAASISNAVRIERAARTARPRLTPPERFARWLEPFVMPYTIGAFYSLLLFVAVCGALRPQIGKLRDLAEAARLEAHATSRVAWIGGEDETLDLTPPLSPALYAAARSKYGAESPSLNPRGALAQLAWTPAPAGRPHDDDMIVVADVYGNGSASLTAVVEAPRNPRMLGELQDALRKNPAFVPASLDRRPQTMRVVFVLQKMNVEDSGSY